MKKKQKQPYKYDIIPIRLHKGNEYIKEKLLEKASELSKSRNDILNELLVNFCN